MFPFSLDGWNRGLLHHKQKKDAPSCESASKSKPPSGLPGNPVKMSRNGKGRTSAKQVIQTRAASCHQKTSPLADRLVLRTAAGMGETLRFCCAALYRELPENATKYIRNFLMPHPGGHRHHPLEARICGRSNWHMDMRNDPLQESEFPVTVHSQSRFKCGATFQIELGAANRSSSGFPSPCPCRRAPRIFDSMRAWIPLTPPN